MIDLYYWPTPNGWKISIALEELELPYALRPVNIGAGEQFKPEFLAISPNNRMPAIVDPNPPGGGAPLSVFESGAILLYLGEKTGKLLPQDLRGRYDVTQWLMWQMGGLGPMAGQLGHFKNYAPDKIPYAIKRYQDEVNRLFGVMNRRLTDREFLGGEYSIADIACFGWVHALARAPEDTADFPHLQIWLDTLRARPAVKRGLAVGEDLRRPITDEAKKVLFGQTHKNLPT